MSASIPAHVSNTLQAVNTVGIMAAIVWGSMLKDALAGESGIDQAVETAIKLYNKVGQNRQFKV